MERSSLDVYGMTVAYGRFSVPRYRLTRVASSWHGPQRLWPVEVLIKITNNALSKANGKLLDESKKGVLIAFRFHNEILLMVPIP